MPLDGWKEKLFRQYLRWTCRPARLKKRLSTLITGSRVAPPIEDRLLKVAALQVKISLFKDPLDYVNEMHRRVSEALAAGVHLVAFPEDNNLSLLGMLPGVEEMGKALSDGDLQDAPANTSEITIADVIHYIGPVIAPFLDKLYSILAAAYGLYLMAGSFILPDGGNVVNRSFLYGPDGRLIGTQDKVHLMPIETEWGISPGTGFKLFETAAGRIATPVCMDASYFETFRILELQGAEIVIIPIANPEPYNYWLALRGIWPRVQECPVYGIKSALVGNLLGFTFTGRAGIFAPSELTPDGSGVLDEVVSPETEGIAVAEIDLNRLKKLRREHPWRDSNPDLYRRYFPHAYSTIFRK
ncbi:MAG: nitrilase [Firmicutes bacterium]|mgnify:CR=1 FL=1|jgi:predicted amidohydrolase|nr:nitrilase [Bacillota bacterium]